VGTETAAEVLDNLADELAGEGVIRGTLFGKQCLKLHGKAFLCAFHDAMVFKLDSDSLEGAMSLEGARRFDPSASGRAMREWVEVPPDHAAAWRGLAHDALQYSRESQQK
jgi:hypothetical protein